MDQYEALCDQCNQQLHENIHIFIMTNSKTGEEQTVCSNCRNDVDWESEWHDDEEEDNDE